MADLFQRSDIVGIATTAIDSIINQLSKTATLFFPSVFQPCANCIFDPIGKKSSNYYRDGGPIPFPNMSTCPVCNGEGTRATEVTDTMQMLCEIVPQQWYLWPILKQQGIKIPQGTVEIKAYQSDLPKFLRADFIEIANEQIGSFKRYRYKISGEPVDPSNIVQGRYFVCLLDRVD